MSKLQILTHSYAKVFYQLGKEKKVDICGELGLLTETINGSNHLENVLFLNIFTEEEKISVLNDILKKLKTSELLNQLCAFLIREKRISYLPMIYKELVIIDDDEQGFIRGVLEGREAKADKEFETQLLALLKKFVSKKIVLKYQTNKKLKAGYRVTLGDLQLDATLDEQLKRFQKSVFKE